MFKVACSFGVCVCGHDSEPQSQWTSGAGHCVVQSPSCKEFMWDVMSLACF